MHPFSYTTVKIIHEETVQKALEQHHTSQERKAAAERGPRRVLASFFARFHRPAAPVPHPCTSCDPDDVACPAA